MLSDRRAEYGLAVHPIIVDVPEVVEEEEAEPAEAILLAATKEVLGWKTAYRLAEPDAKKTEDMRLGLRLTIEALGACLQWTATQRHRSTETKLIAFQAAYEALGGKAEGPAPSDGDLEGVMRELFASMRLPTSSVSI